MGLKLTAWFEHGFRYVLSSYERGLDWALFHKRTVLGIAIGTLLFNIALFVAMPKGFFPNEDIGQALITVEAVEDIFHFPRWLNCCSAPAR